MIARKKATFLLRRSFDDDLWFVLDQHAVLNCYNVSAIKPSVWKLTP